MSDVVPTAHARGPRVSASAVLLAAGAGVARSGMLIRMVANDLSNGRSMVIVDFGSGEAELLAVAANRYKVVLVEAGSREAVFPHGGWTALPRPVADGLAATLATWLRPHGAMADGRDVERAVSMLAALPVLLPRFTLYGWKRFFADRAWRTECLRDLRKLGADPAALDQVRPGTTLFRVLEGRVVAVLGHDELLDRVFSHRRSHAPLRASGAPGASRCGAPSQRVGVALGCPGVDPGAGRAGGLAPAESTGSPRPCRALDRGGSAGVDIAAAGVDSGLCGRFDGYDRRPPPPLRGQRRALVLEPACGVVQRRSGRVADRAGLPLVRGRRPADTRGAPSRPPGSVSPARRTGPAGRGGTTCERAPAGGSGGRSAWRGRRDNGGFSCLAWRLCAIEPDWRRTRDAPRAGSPPTICWSGASRPTGSRSRGGAYAETAACRALMGAAAQVLSAVLDPTMSDHSHAYRPNRGARRAICELAAAPDLGTSWAIVSDIASYFDSIDHRLLVAMLREHVADERFLRILESWLTNPVRDQGHDHPNRKGVPQGAAISPVLANLYLTPLDRWMERRGVVYARYADDFVALCPSEASARNTANDLEAFLARELRLAVKPSKSAFVPVAQGYDFLGFRLDAAGARIAEARVADCVDAVRALLGTALDRAHLRELDARVRGFRNYFDLPFAALAAQLAELDTQREGALRGWCDAERLPVAAVLARAERFVVGGGVEPVPTMSGYPDAEADPDDDVPATPLAEAIKTSLAVVDRTVGAVAARATDKRPVAAVSAGHLNVFGFGVAAALEGERLVVRKKREAVFEVPLAALRSVHLQTYGMAITTPVLEALAEREVPVLFSHPGGRVWGAVRANVHKGSGDLLAAQLAARGGPLGISVAQALIGAKLVNQERLLRYYAKYKGRKGTPVGEGLIKAAETIEGLRRRVHEVDSEELEVARKRIFSAEGRAGAAYWGALGGVLGEGFPGRIGRGARDPINSAFNYGYGILYGALWCAILKAGLEPGVGVLHASTGDRASLVFDLIGPFRVPAVDRPLHGFFGRGGTVKLNKDGHLSASSRRGLARLVGAGLSAEQSWAGTSQTIAAHVEAHATQLAIWFRGGSGLDPLRIRW